MRRLVSTAALLSVVVALTTFVAPAAHAAPAADVVTVDANGGSGETSFATVPDLAYLVTVTGAYEGEVSLLTFGTADCGWWFRSDGPERNNEDVTVDGHPAGCQSQAYSTAHTYQWTESGTGAPFHFAISAVDRPEFTAGYLTFTVTGARANVAHSVTGFCFPHAFPSPALDYVPVVVEAGAQASEATSAASTTISCDVTSGSGEAAHIRQGLPGPLVESADRMVVPPGDSLHVCYVASATWDDGIDRSTPSTCYTLYL
jgi:hypothetical protein